MSYEPQEGIDYIVDFYAIAGVEHDTEEAGINKAINKQLSQYHPDRLEGVAPEFQARGERMAQILNKARGILLNADKRQQYDAIYDDWDGPVSTTGDPAIRIEDAMRAEMSMRSEDDVIAVFFKLDKEADMFASSSQSRADLFERMIEQSGDNAPDDLREQYEATLLEIERNLDVKESQRTSLMGVTSPVKFSRVTLGYSEEIGSAIEVAKTTQLEVLQARALGGVAQKLAILSGDTQFKPADSVDIARIQLPAYFEPLAEQVTDIAEKRQSILEKRLANFIPTYPEYELQQDAKTGVIFGLGEKGADQATYRWFTFIPDFSKGAINSVEMPEVVNEMISVKNYQAVFDAGFNVALFSPLEHIDLETLLNEAINKYVDKYYPDDEENSDTEA